MSRSKNGRVLGRKRELHLVWCVASEDERIYRIEIVDED